jgi:hypothetical protein
LSFTWFNDLLFEDMLKRVATLPPQSAIYFYFILADAANVAREEDFVFPMLHAVANTPIFSDRDAHFGSGIVGGPLISTEERSRKAVGAAVRILHGEAPSDINTPSIGFSTPKFDWREMRRWDISEARLPTESEIYFRDPSAWNQYKAQIFAVIAAILVQASLIGWLLHERQYRRRAEKAARETMSELTQLNRIATAGELSATIAHEVNQPLAGIVTRANAALRWLSGENPNVGKARDALDKIVTAGHHASDVITSVRAMFRKDTQQKGPVDINKLIRSVLGLVYMDLRKQSIESRIDLGEDLAPVIGNEDRILEAYRHKRTLRCRLWAGNWHDNCKVIRRVVKWFCCLPAREQH